MDKLLTVIVPVYKVEPYINKCLDSLILEDENLMNRLEVVIVNDGTPDRSAEMSREYVKRYPNTFRQIDKENGGHGSAWNVGLKEATGKYLRFLDSDDWLTNLDKLMKILDSADVDLVVTEMSTFDEQSGIATKSSLARTYGQVLPIAAREFGGNMSNFWCSTYKSSLLKSLYPLFLEGVSYGDSVLYLVPHICGKDFLAYDFVVYNYLVGREGQSMSVAVQTKKIPDMFKNYRHLQDFVERHNNGIYDGFINEVFAHHRWTLFNLIPYVEDYQLSFEYMKQLKGLGSLDHINTKKYRRFKLLPYRLFHFLENKKRRKNA